MKRGLFACKTKYSSFSLIMKYLKSSIPDPSKTHTKNGWSWSHDLWSGILGLWSRSRDSDPWSHIPGYDPVILWCRFFCCWWGCKCFSPFQSCLCIFHPFCFRKNVNITVVKNKLIIKLEKCNSLSYRNVSIIGADKVGEESLCGIDPV